MKELRHGVWWGYSSSSPGWVDFLRYREREWRHPNWSVEPDINTFTYPGGMTHQMHRGQDRRAHGHRRHRLGHRRQRQRHHQRRRQGLRRQGRRPNRARLQQRGPAEGRRRQEPGVHRPTAHLAIAAAGRRPSRLAGRLAPVRHPERPTVRHAGPVAGSDLHVHQRQRQRQQDVSAWMPPFRILDYIMDIPWGTVIRQGVILPDSPPSDSP